jgi:hypothetical protein
MSNFIENYPETPKIPSQVGFLQRKKSIDFLQVLSQINLPKVKNKIKIIFIGVAYDVCYEFCMMATEHVAQVIHLDVEPN